MRDLMKKGLLQPMKKSAQDDNTPMGKYEAYYTYHQWKGHSTKFCKRLEATILDLIFEGKYQIEGIKAKEDLEVHMISIDKRYWCFIKKGTSKACS